MVQVDKMMPSLDKLHAYLSVCQTTAIILVSNICLLKEEHDEIGAKQGEMKTLQWEHCKSMPFTQCVVNETMQVANIISGVFQRAITDVTIRDGYVIPKGWKVFLSFRSVHMNHDYFKDARTFNPWRWQSSSEAPPKRLHPIRGRARRCLGAELARVELSVFLHRLVTQFSWVPAEQDKLVFFPTTRTQKRYPIIVHRLNEAEATL